MDKKELQKQSENNKTAISINLPIIILNIHLIQEYTERIIHHDQVGVIPGMKGFFSSVQSFCLHGL